VRVNPGANRLKINTKNLNIGLFYIIIKENQHISVCKFLNL
jgi:hypothetical protein